MAMGATGGGRDGLTWILLSVVLVFLAGVAFYVAREDMGSTLDGILPTWRSTPAVEAEIEEEAAEPAPPIAPEIALECDVEELVVVQTLVDPVERLLAEGRVEVRDFQEMNAEGDVGRVLRNRWERWGGVWRNRTKILRDAMPPHSMCREQADLVVACDTVELALGLLEQVPAARSTAEAEEIFDRAQGFLDEFRQAEAESADRLQALAEFEAEASAQPEIAVP